MARALASDLRPDKWTNWQRKCDQREFNGKRWSKWQNGELIPIEIDYSSAVSANDPFQLDNGSENQKF